MAVAVVAVLALGVPLAYLSARMVREDARARLAREAAHVLLAVEDDLTAGRPPNSDDISRTAGDNLAVKIVTAAGEQIEVGRASGSDIITATADDGRGNRAIVRRDAASVTDRMQTAVGVVMAISLGALATAAVLAVVGGRRLAQPLAGLADHAARIGAGEVSSEAPRVGLAEIDAVADALDKSMNRLAAMLQAERDFTANASHQLRTPLTALRLRLEPILWEPAEGPPAAATRQAVEAALAEADRLEATIDALLLLARTGRAGPAWAFDLAQLVTERSAAWAGAFRVPGRELRLAPLDSAGALEVRASPAAVGEALDVLLDNSLRHGAGQTKLGLRRAGAYAVLAVEDEGAGIAPGEEGLIFERGRSHASTGIGLALARSLVEADGGRLELARSRPPRFELFVPTTARLLPTQAANDPKVLRSRAAGEAHPAPPA